MGPRSPGTSAAPARIANVPPSRVSIDRRCGGEHPGTWPPIGSGYRRVRSGCSARRNVTLVRPGPIGGWFPAARPAGTSHSFGPCGSMGSLGLRASPERHTRSPRADRWVVWAARPAGTSHSIGSGRSVGGFGLRGPPERHCRSARAIDGYVSAAQPAGTRHPIPRSRPAAARPGAARTYTDQRVPWGHGGCRGPRCGPGRRAAAATARRAGPSGPRRVGTGQVSAGRETMAA